MHQQILRGSFSAVSKPNNVAGLVHFVSVDGAALGHNRVVQLPALSVSLSDVYNAATSLAKFDTNHPSGFIPSILVPLRYRAAPAEARLQHADRAKTKSRRERPLQQAESAAACAKTVDCWASTVVFFRLTDFFS